MRVLGLAVSSGMKLFAAFVLSIFAFPLRAQSPTAALNTDLADVTKVGTVITYSSATSYTGTYSFTSGAYLNSNPRQFSSTGGYLFYSDSPETVPSAGILYRDLVPAGDARIYLYHVNNTGSNAKITSVLQNAGSSTANITITRKALPTPSSNFVSVGKSGSQQFYTTTNTPSAFTLAPGSSALLDAALDSTVVANGELLHSVHDYTSDQPLTVTALILSSASTTLSVFGSQSFVANDANKRQGTYTHSTRENLTAFTYDTTENIKRVRIADQNSLNVDSFMPGTDAESSNASSPLSGNYGVNYKINISVVSSDSRKLALLVNPRGGTYAGYFKVTTPSGTFGQMVPSSSNIPDGNSAGMIGRLDPLSSARTITIEFMPAGASPLPIEIALVPYTGTTFELAAPVHLTELAAE